MTDLFRESSPQNSMEGTLQRVVFHNPDSGWTVARFERQDGQQSVTVVGTLTGISEGEALRVHGRWVEDSRYGQQFAVDLFDQVAGHGVRRLLFIPRTAVFTPQGFNQRLEALDGR